MIKQNEINLHGNNEYVQGDTLYIYKWRYKYKQIMCYRGNHKATYEI